MTGPAGTAFAALGLALTAAGAVLWILALWKAGFGKHIRENKPEALYGQPYRDYCRRVNRCIPWFPA